MEFHQFFHGRESDAVAPVLSLAPLRAEEVLKDGFVHFLQYADTVVRHAEDHPVGLVGYGQFHVAPFAGIFEGIGDQIGEDCLQLVKVEIQLYGSVCRAERIADALLCAEVMIVFGEVSAKFHHIFMLQVQLRFARFQFPDVNNTADEVVKFLRVAVHGIKKRARHRHGRLLLLLEFLYLGPYEKHRCAQFVRDTGIEVHLCLVEFLHGAALYIHYLYAVLDVQFVQIEPEGGVYHTCQQQGPEQIGPPRGIPRRGDDDIQFRGPTPLAVYIGTAHMEGIVSRWHVCVGRFALVAQFAPAVFEPFEATGELHPMGRLVVGHGKMDGEEVLVVLQFHASDGVAVEVEMFATAVKQVE